MKIKSISTWTITTALFSCVFLSAYWFRLADYDLFARVAVGRLITLSHWVPLVDPFAYSPTKDVWIDHEWLSGLIFYGVSQIKGDVSLFIFDLVIAYVTIFLLVSAQHMLTPNSRLGFTLLFSAIFPCTFIWNSVVRSQVFTFLFFAFLLLLLSKIRARKDSKLQILFITPLIFVLWANAHGGFVVGLGYLVLGCVGLTISKHKSGSTLILVTLLSIAAVLINPYGIDYIHFIQEAVLMPRTHITEWAATSLSAQSIIFFIFCGLTLFSLASKERKAIPLEGWLFLFVSMYFALCHQRHVPFYIFTACVYLPLSLEQSASTLSKWVHKRGARIFHTTAFLAACTSIVAVATFLHLLWNISNFQLDYSKYPVEAMRWLRSHARGGKLMVHFNEGSYALLTGYPEFKVAMDGRYEEVYSESIFRQALSALDPNAPDFVTSFQALRPDFVILCKTTTPHTVADLFPGNWKQVYLESSGNCALYTDQPELISSSLPQNTSAWKINF